MMQNPILFETGLLIIGMIYFFVGLYLLSQKNPSKSTPEKLPRVAILIAMRNEQEYIADALKSLTNQNYPKNLHNIYVLDDNSDDHSVKVASEIIDRHENFYLLKIRDEQHGLKGKMNALAQGLDKIDHDIVLITDADCEAPPDWISTHVSYFEQDTGLVAGLTSLSRVAEPVKEAGQWRLFDKIQSLDWLYLQTLAVGSSQAGKPITVLGNNFGFRKAAYDELGGFKTLGFSVTEDFLLMQAMLKETHWKVKHTLDLGNTIFSHPVKNWPSFLKQRKRWVTGGKAARPWAYFIVGLSTLAHLAMLSVFILQWWKMPAALSIGLIIGIDYFIIKKITGFTGLHKLRKYFLIFEVYYIFYLLLFSVWTFIPQKVHWKNRKF